MPGGGIAVVASTEQVSPTRWTVAVFKAMAREFPRVHDFYLQFHEVQLPVQHFHHFELTPGPENSGAPLYELTVAGGSGACVSSEPGPSCSTAGTVSAAQTHNDHRKRKCASFGTASTYDDDGGEDARSTRSMPDKKQNHSEIEKRRRDKMNTYISELSSMIPMCGAMARKLDKLTVLRMAVQHLRSVRGALSAGPLTIKPRPAYLSERELNNLVLHAAHDAFIIVVGCDRGRLLYVSTSVSQMLNYDQAELLGQSLFDILHPKDVAKVKEQLSSSNICPRERLIDAKTMLPVKSEMMAGASRLGPGARRSFFCRIKCRALLAPRTPITQDSDSSDANRSTQIKEENKMRKRSVHDKKYCVVQCTGYLKSWAPADVSEGCGSSNGSGCGEVGDGGDDSDASNMCLVAVGRALHDLIPQQAMRTNFPTPATRLLQYVSRHATDGKFLFVDQRVTLALGFLPQELLGTSLYEYVGASELSSVARTHKAALLQRDSMLTTLYSHRRKDGNFATIQTQFKPFRNPWTKDVEYLVANNTVVSGEQATQLAGRSDTHTHYDIYKQRSSETGDRGGGVPPSDVERSLSESDVEMQRLIDSQVESHKIGSAIAEEVFRRSSPVFSPELPADLFQDTIFSTQSSLVDNILGLDSPYIHVRNNVSLSSAAGSSSSPLPSGDGVNTATSTEGSPPPSSPPIPPLAVDGNGEAAMAVIMSLLEAEAGLGGPVNTSGLPWPLP